MTDLTDLIAMLEARRSWWRQLPDLDGMEIEGALLTLAREIAALKARQEATNG